MQEDIDLSVVIVSWKVCRLLRSCLASLAASPGVNWVTGSQAPGSPEALGALAGSAGPLLRAEAIVVDNASDDGSAAMVATEFPWVRLVANHQNRGFTGGNNQALALCRGQFVFFLNPDTEVTGDALARMVAYLKSNPGAGALGPQLRYGDGSPQSSRRRFPTLAMALFESTPLAWHIPVARNRWARRYHMSDTPPGDSAQRVDWVVGAALLVRRTALDRIGGFDEGYFMYSEELDWCRRAAAAGWHTVYLPSAVVIHHEGKSSEQAVTLRHLRFQRSKVRYFRKFHGALAAEILRAFILASYAGEWLLEAAKWLAGSRRDMRRGRLATYGQLLRSGLRWR